jgi:hypothetical protein
MMYACPSAPDNIGTKLVTPKIGHIYMDHFLSQLPVAFS